MTTPKRVRDELDQMIQEIGLLDSLDALHAFQERSVEVAADSSLPSTKVLNSRAQVWPTIARRGIEHVESDRERVYGATTDPIQQRQADAGYWRAGEAIREQCLPLIVSEDGIVVRAWSVNEWSQNEYGKWAADLGRALDNSDLEELRSPLLIGDALPTAGQTAFWPVFVDIDGNVYRAREHVGSWLPTRKVFDLAFPSNKGRDE
ncbi:hypothetical protein [Corynebacterium sp. AOP12-C2-36]|uniref:hypothetical protein n=1 Tax=Corynebacterium sp. AOP12-C2-36 TaxID=3457723 RepID=UPI0040343885